MSRARRILVISGLTLAVWGMGWGLFYALFVEHQTLDAMGSHITTAFVRGAERNLPQSRAALAAYSGTEFDYVRQVDVHSHWIGLAMVLIILGVVFDHVSFGENFQVSLALMLAAGAVLFPLGVILQTLWKGVFPSAVAVIGAALVIAGMSGAAWGFARTHPAP